MTENQLEKAGEYLVAKHMDLIVNVRHDLSKQEQKIIAYMVSKVKPTDAELKFVAFRISDFYELIGSSDSTIEGGMARRHLKANLKSLSDKSFWITRDDGKDTLCRWIHKATLDYDQDTVLLRLDEDLVPFLVGLRGRFLEYQLYFILQMTSSYSIRLYEILKGEVWKKIPMLCTTEEFRRLLGADNVKMYKKNSSVFMAKCIRPAVKEINELTDIKVRCKEIRGDTRGRPLTHLQFIIRLKNDVEIEKAKKANEDRRGGQIAMNTPQTNAEAFPVDELAENIEDLQQDYEELPRKWQDCKTFAQLQAWRAKNHPEYHYNWPKKAAADLGIEVPE